MSHIFFPAVATRQSFWHPFVMLSNNFGQLSIDRFQTPENQSNSTMWHVDRPYHMCCSTIEKMCSRLERQVTVLHEFKRLLMGQNCLTGSLKFPVLDGGNLF